MEWHFEMHNLPKFMQEEIGHHNWPVSIVKIELIMKRPSHSESTIPNGKTSKFHQKFTE